MLFDQPCCCTTGIQCRSIYVYRKLAGWWGIGNVDNESQQYIGWFVDNSSFPAWADGGLWRQAYYLHGDGTYNVTMTLSALINAPTTTDPNGLFVAPSLIQYFGSPQGPVANYPDELSSTVDQTIFTVATPVDFVATFKTITDQMKSLVQGGDFNTLNWFLVGGANLGGPYADFWNFNDADNGGIPGDISGIDYSGYNGAPQQQFGLDPEGFAFPNYPLPASFAGYDDQLMVAAESQVLILGPYALIQYIMMSDGTFLIDTFNGNDPCIKEGTGDGVTPITIPLPSPEGLPGSLFTDNVNLPLPFGRIIKCVAGNC